MGLSRVDSRARDRNRRRRRLRQLALLNIGMLFAIAALVYGIASGHWLHGREDSSGTPNPPLTADEGPASEPDGSSPQDEGTASAEGGEDKGANNATDAGTGADDAGDGNDVTPAPSEEAEPEPAEEPVRLAFVGDILLASSVEKLMRREGFDYPYAKALPYLQEPDLTIGNLENPITTRGTPAENKKYVFKGSPELLPSLREAGIDFVSLANNHTLDQGVEGLLDTIDHLNETNLKHAGAGRNDEEAFKPAVFDVRGMSIAIFSLSRVVPEVSWKADKNHPGVAETYDPRRAVEAIERARESHDLIIVYAHWGEELSRKPRDIEKQLARAYIDAGADLVVGSHPHVLQGFEHYNGRWIAYSLGNFIFNVTKNEDTRDTGVLNAVCTKGGGCELQFVPMRAIEPSRPEPLEGEARQAMLDQLERISFGVTVGEDGTLRPAAEAEDAGAAGAA
ncbi:MAG: capsule biosynthesis protein [Thermobacillus sp.]|uniref:CapA family protein n=1 Tax=Thermobacillus sp. TaxID=2108467 RepID=UPI000E3750FB|nr:CapA family protein [Thermobacillus sp.]REK57229.1 MAG: capsule biosynthesis protein [Thermobacillus sp.]